MFGVYVDLGGFVILGQLEQQQDELQQRLNQKLQELQQEGNEKILLLESQLKTLTERLKMTEAQIASVTSASNADPAALDAVLSNVEVFLQLFTRPTSSILGSLGLHLASILSHRKNSIPPIMLSRCCRCKKLTFLRSVHVFLPRMTFRLTFV